MPHDASSHERREPDANSGGSPPAGDAATSPLPEPAELSPAELEEARRYNRERLVCGLLDKGVDVAFLTVAAFLVARPLDDWLAAYSLLSHLWARLAVMFLLVAVAGGLVSLPLAFYEGYILEHRYGLSRQTPLRWLWRTAKRAALGLAFGLFLIEGLYCVIWLAGAYWWLAATGAFFLVSAVLGHLVPLVIIPLFYKVERVDEPELIERFGRLAEGTGLAIEGVYRIDMSSETVKANAMLAGLGRSRRVLLGDTLLGQFTSDEIEVVMAHEVGHHVHRHIPKLMLLGLIFSAATFFVCDLALRAALATAGTPLDYGTLPVWTLPLVLLVITGISFVLGPVQNAISRHFERQCDRYALDRTRRAGAFMTAFKKLARLNKADPAPHPLEVLLFYSHPPIAERLAAAEQESA